MATGTSQDNRRRAPGRRLTGRLVFAAACLVLAALAARVWFRQPRVPPPGTRTALGSPTIPAAAQPFLPDAVVFAGYAGSGSCRECHARAYEQWRTSHHALAERPVDPALDLPLFDPPSSFRHGTQVSEARCQKQRFEVITLGGQRRRQVFPVERVIGVDPLRQFLLPVPGGRFQVTEIAADPNRRDWFDIFGQEDREPGEWGHWTGRGMTWNSMCAACHNTRVRKNYRSGSDSYATRMAEVGVGCEACHGPLSTHVAWQRRQPRHPPLVPDPTLQPLTKDRMLAACGSCHARRVELTGDFQPGDLFSDHYGLIIPDETDLFYADGQVREEDYEFTAFLGSKMFTAGVRCGDCHDPHTAKTHRSDNLLCLRCHSAPLPPAPKIDAGQHSFHKAGETGDRCTDCHMPQTIYMQRHARHDHGFTIPDPELTLEHGIPNACNRCHKDKTIDWARQTVGRWYGDRMNRSARLRTRSIMQARAGERAAIDPLKRLAREEKAGLWRAAATGLLKPWVREADVTALVVGQTSEAEPLVRAFAVRALEPLAGSDDAAVTNALFRLLSDPVRLVRVEAAWSLRARLDTNAPAGKDLIRHLEHNLDQPAGLLQMGVLHLDRGDPATAVPILHRAVEWDPRSAPLRQALAVGLSLQGRKTEAVRELEIACRLAPKEAEYRFKLGLALNEAGGLTEAVAALEEAIRLEPRFTQAWYNLGLARASAGQPEPALEALARAESQDARSPLIPYARATILARLGRVNEARAAARRALEIEPGFTDAAVLLERDLR